MIVFKIIYWLGLVGQIIIRAPFQRMSRNTTTIQRHTSLFEQTFPLLLTIGLLLLPLMYSVSNWLDFANYTLPDWMGWLGVLLHISALVVFWRSHVDLKDNWSPTLEIHQEHALITQGIYRVLRHPMYASQWLWVIAQCLLLQNWLAGPTNIILWGIFYFMRVGAEEKLMLENFGDAYRLYMKQVGGVIPRGIKARDNTPGDS